MTAKHVHVGGIAVIGFVATLYAVNFLVRTAAAHHPDNPAVQALVYGI
jgi:hypothetical protein